MPESELFQLLRRHSPAQAVLLSRVADRGLADEARFPFLALVGQAEMKLALVLTLINPAAGGVLLIGPRGTGKTTAVRGLLDLLPQVQRNTCPNGCEPQAAEIVLFEAARAHAAADGRAQANRSDLRAVASMALRQRRSRFMDDYFAAQVEEEQELASVVRGNSIRPRR